MVCYMGMHLALLRLGFKGLSGLAPPHLSRQACLKPSLQSPVDLLQDAHSFAADFPDCLHLSLLSPTQPDTEPVATGPKPLSTPKSLETSSRVVMFSICFKPSHQEGLLNFQPIRLHCLALRPCLHPLPHSVANASSQSTSYDWVTRLLLENQLYVEQH